MEISGSCFSSHLAAAQMEATLTPKLTSQAWSHGAVQEKQHRSAPTEPGGCGEQWGSALAAPWKHLCSFTAQCLRQRSEDEFVFQCEIIMGRCEHTHEKMLTLFL